jgi:cation transport protein ChaC
VVSVRPAADGPIDADGHLYVFGYGSLIWRPGFSYLAAVPALLRGFHRCFCLRSHRYRGTAAVPGLVLGLDRGGACRGVAFRVAAAEAEPVLQYLDARELPDGSEIVYDRRVLRVAIGAEARMVRAVTYVARRASPHYCGRLTPEAAAAIIARGRGETGSNREYLLNTLAHLGALGLRDPALDRIAALLPAEPALID